MASKKSTPLDDPPSASSESSESESEDEQEQQEIITQKSIPQPTSSTSESETSGSDESDDETPEPKIQTPVPKPPPSSDSESSEPGSESESEHQTPHKPSIFEFESDIKSPSASDFAIKPSKKIKTFQTSDKNPTLKRHISGPSDNNNNKKSKIVSNGDTEDEKKAVIKRVWSEDDEIMLLQGFIEYQLKNGYSPLSDMDGFYRFSMDNIPGNASKSQLYEKVRRLKKKFRVNVEKVGPNGKDPVFAKPHDAKIFEISKKIWGVDGCESGANFKAKTPVPKPKAAPKVKTPVKVKAKVEEKVDEVMEEEDVDDDKVDEAIEDFETLYPYWNVGLNNEVSTSLKFPAGIVELVKENMSVIGEDKAKEMDEKWKALLEDEAKLQRKRIALLSKVGYVET
uniref:STOREKEEPER protein-like n=1 Tax=Erigeron canadensis TaxID=72917 RepID=UPI001CB8C622|nr:STOREKEEPER protein-like [Erigeron canadensis]